ncbi:MAG: heavy-metal-associated domain-containing protein [Brevinematales bacterium]|nr:heavy-metal-associated domain-containing protein [Brevinematales bacterium]
METRFIVKGMKCQGCLQTVKEILSSVPGVEEVKGDLLTKEVVVKGEVSPTTLMDIIHQKTPYKITIK